MQYQFLNAELKANNNDDDKTHKKLQIPRSQFWLEKNFKWEDISLTGRIPTVYGGFGLYLL